MAVAPVRSSILLRMIVPILAAMAASGCGEPKAAVAPIQKVKGKVIPARPGSLAGAKIEFVPSSTGARTATGELKADGSFELSTYDTNDGVAQGTYKIRFEQVPGVLKKGGTPPIPPAFLDQDTSGLTAEVGPSTTEVGPFSLKPNAVSGSAGSKKTDRSD